MTRAAAPISDPLRALALCTAAAGKFTTLESTDNLSVASDKQVKLEGAADSTPTYMSDDSTAKKLFIYVNNVKVA